MTWASVSDDVDEARLNLPLVLASDDVDEPSAAWRWLVWFAHRCSCRPTDAASCLRLACTCCWLAGCCELVVASAADCLRVDSAPEVGPRHWLAGAATCVYVRRIRLEPAAGVCGPVGHLSGRVEAPNARATVEWADVTASDDGGRWLWWLRLRW